MRYLLALGLLVSALPASATEPAESQPDLVRLLVEADSRQLRANSPATRWTRVEVLLDGTALETATKLADELGTSVLVERAYPLLGPEDEPLFHQQWGLENTGQSGGLVDADIDATEAWDISTGAGVVVAIVDSGVESTHPDLDDQIWANPTEIDNGLDDDGNGYIDDLVGWDFIGWDGDPTPVGSTLDDAHGTFIAGVIAAEANGSGITGVAPDAQIMNLRACNEGFCWSLDTAQAIYYAVDKGADVLNLSFGGPSPIEVGDPVLEAAIDYAATNNVLVVTAAGNTPPGQVPAGQIITPSELPSPNNLSVTASDRHDELASFSYYSPNIDIAAPGVSIRTTDLVGYATVSGTSFAAPFVAGAAAIMLADDPGMTYAELITRLEGFADHPAGIAGKVTSGRLNIGRAMTHQFIDAVDHLFENDIEWAASQGITKGCNPPINTLFCPNQDVTRGVMAAFLRRALNLPAASKDYFSDDNNSIFEDDINRLAEAGITKGCSSTHFCPKNVVDRGQMAAFLARAFVLPNSPTDYFSDDETSIFENDINRIAMAGITRGCNPPTNDQYCPNLSVDRGAMTAFLHRALD